MIQGSGTVDPYAEALLHGALEADIGLIVRRPAGRAMELVFVNRAAEAILGQSADDLGHDAAGVLEGFARASRGAPGPVEAVTRGSDGALRQVEVIARTVEQSGATAEVFFLFDVSAQRRAEERLAASMDTFRRLLDAAPDAVALGSEQRLLYANAAAARLLGLNSPQEVLERRMPEYVHPKDRRRALEALSHVLETGVTEPDLHLNLLRPDGVVVPTEMSAMRVEWMGAPAMLAAARDVSDRRRAQAELARADRLSAIGTLTAGIAHEVNNPLAYVLLNLEYLLKQIRRFDGSETMTGKLVERVGEAQHGARRVRGIVADLRTLARREEKSVGPTSVEAAVRAAARIAGSTFRDRARLVENYHPAPPVEANATKLEQVFVNLIVNAAQAMEDGHADRNEIRVDVFPEGTTVVATVTDTGSGIAPEIVGRIFDPFFTTKPRGTGTGLGLPISYQIVSSYAGELSVESQPGKGATFRVVLPRSERPRFVDPPTPTPPPPPHSTWRARVLVIDDEPLVTDMLRRVFGEMHDVTVTTSPHEGLRWMLERDFDAVFCDLLMPGLTGMDIHEELAKARPGMERRIVFMTGGAFTERASAFLARVSNRRIVKPFELSDLERALAQTAARRH